MEEKMPSFGLWLGLSIAELICCSPIFGIIALVLVCTANSAYKKGDAETGEKQAKTAKILLAVGVGMSLVISILYFVLFGAQIAALQ